MTRPKSGRGGHKTRGSFGGRRPDRPDLWATRTGRMLVAMARAYLAMGSNLGKRQLALRAALARLGRLPGTQVLAVARFRETAPVDAPAGSGKFINSVAVIDTTLAPEELLAAMLGIERDLGRQREGAARNGPRIVDLDLLMYEDRVVRSRELELPHPRMQERRFVLEPLAEVAPEAVHPVLRKTVKQMLAELVNKSFSH
jgi:3-oxoacyl-[acyl-carrier protein] reductase